MQEDMHYYGTYGIARAAGLKPKDAQIIAYSAQFVDDSTMTNSKMNKNDHGLIYGVATAHHPKQVIKQHIKEHLKYLLYRKKVASLKERRIWIPFHFYPGNEGNTLSKKLICRKNSLIVNEMFDNHIKHVKEFPYILHLIGIASHIYMDTFSHYGFSGLSSRNNKVLGNSFEFNGEDSKEYIEHLSKFEKKYRKEYFSENWRNKSFWVTFFSSLSILIYRIPFVHKIIHGAISSLAEFSTGAIGHGSVATFPDQPYLKWSFKYELENKKSNRDNLQTYLEGCEELYKKLRKFSELYYENGQIKFRAFSEIKETVKKILSYKSDVKEGCSKRVLKWKEVIKKGKIFDISEEEFLDYDEKKWRLQKDILFEVLESSSEATQLDVYKFHQAADYHRHYTLKDLLPKHGIIVN